LAINIITDIKPAVIVVSAIVVSAIVVSAVVVSIIASVLNNNLSVNGNRDACLTINGFLAKAKARTLVEIVITT